MCRLSFAFVLVLSACATDMQRVEREVGKDQPIQYKVGYKAGCDSGYVAAGHPYYQFNKDVSLYGSDVLYKQGWDDGFSICKGKYESVQRSLR